MEEETGHVDAAGPPRLGLPTSIYIVRVLDTGSLHTFSFLVSTGTNTRPGHPGTDQASARPRGSKNTPTYPWLIYIPA